AARRWMLGMERGPARDAALSAYLRRMAASGDEEDDRFYEAFSSGAAREEAVAAAAIDIARREPDRAAALVERRIADPARRANAERAIEAVRRQPNVDPTIGLPR